MPFNGTGVFTLQYNWETEKLTPPIATSKLDTQDQDVATGLSNCMTRDGQSLPTANIPMNGKRLINLGDPTSDQDAVTLAYLQANAVGVDAPAFTTRPLVGSDKVAVQQNAYKSASTDRSSTISPAIDPHLQVVLHSSFDWAYELLVFYQTLSGTAQGLRFFMNVLGGAHANHRALIQHYDGSAFSAFASAQGDSLESNISLSSATADADHILRVNGTIEVTGQTTLGLAWSQVTSQASATRVLLGSYLIATRIVQ